MSRTDVLVAGAGPTGLVLALWLSRLGVRVRIVDKAAEPGRTSRAIGVQARTLEEYRFAGIAPGVVAAGFPESGLNFWVKGERRARLELRDIGKGLSPYPYLLAYAQDEHEKFLISKLTDLGVDVERSTELAGLDPTDDGMVARLRKADGSVELCHASYVAGCDGARSFVRESLKIGYPGGTYAHTFYVADVAASGPTMNGEAHFAFDDDSNLLACIALGPGHARLIGTVRDDAVRSGGELRWDDVSRRVIELLALKVESVNWFSTYRVHHRVAMDFRVGRVFLVGDAAHIHSPVGGQGMNTGIGDAINLAWKLAATLHGHVDPYVLESYERERLPFAKRLVRSTDRMFELLSARGPIAARMRVGVMPRLMKYAFDSEKTRRFLFRTISQIGVRYRKSWLSEGSAGTLHGGDRLPWVPANGSADNFAPLASLGWQIHVYGRPSDYLASACAARHLPLHAFEWSAAAESAGLARDAAYLVRPDGYVALAADSTDAPERLGNYLARRNIRFDSNGTV